MSDYSVKAVLSAVDSSFTSTLNKAQGALDKLQSGNMSGLGFGVLAGIGMKAMDILTSAVGTLSSHMDSAISRVDTLNNFPKVMESMGFSAEDAAKSVKVLSEGIDGLPTTLDDVVSSAQSLGTLTGNLEESTKLSLALNDAFLASGSSSADASRGLRQYSQMLSKGKVDAQSWYTLQETMGVSLNKVAKAMLGAKAGSMDLYEALKSGDITFDQFNSKLIEMDGRLEDGSVGMEGFASTALTATGGIKTAMTNIGTAITKGLANSIDAANKHLEAKGLPTIQKTLEDFKGKINSAFSTLIESKAFEKAVEKIGKAVQWLGDNTSRILSKIKPYWDALKKAVSEVAKAFGDAIGEIVKEFNKINGTEASLNGFKSAINTVKTALIGLAGAMKKLAPYIAKFITWLPKLAVGFTALKVVSPILSGIIKVAKPASSAIGKFIKAMSIKDDTAAFAKSCGLSSDALQKLGIASSSTTTVLGRLGSAISSIPTAGLVGFAVTAKLALDKLIFSLSSTGKAMGELSSTYTSIETVADNIKNYKSSLDDSFASAEANATIAKQLAGRLDELAGKSSRTAEEQSEMESIVSRLNSIYPEMELAIDGVNGALNKSPDYVYAYAESMEYLAKKEAVFEIYKKAMEDNLKAAKDLDTLTASTDAFTESLTAMAGKNLVAGISAAKWINGVREADQNVKDSNESMAWALQLYEDISKQADAATAKVDSYGYAVTESADGATAAAETTDAATSQMATSWDEVYESVSKNVSGMTSAFDELSGSQKASWEEMKTNLANQVQAYSNWNKNVSDLMSSTLYSQDESFRSMVNQIASAGIDMAPELQALVDNFDGSKESIDTVLSDWSSLETAKSEMTTHLTDIGYYTQEGWGAVVQHYEEANTNLATAGAEMATTLNNNALNYQASLGQVNTIMPGFVTAVANAAAGTVEQASNLTNGTAAALSSGTGAIQGAANGVTSSVGGIASGIANESGAAQTEAAALTSGAAAGITNATGNVKTAVTGVINAMKSQTGTAMQIGGAMGKAFSNALKSSLSGVSSISRSASLSAASGFRAGYGSAFSSGSYMGQGLVNGLRSQLGAVQAVARQLAATAAAAIEQKARIGSPSKVTTWQGSMIGQGLVNGIKAKIGAVHAAASRLYESAYTPSPAFAGAGYSYSPVIVNDAPVILDGRKVGQMTSPYTRTEIARLDRFDARKAGTK